MHVGLEGVMIASRVFNECEPLQGGNFISRRTMVVFDNAYTMGGYDSCLASMKRIFPLPSLEHTPQIKSASSFAHAFCPQSGQVYSCTGGVPQHRCATA